MIATPWTDLAGAFGTVAAAIIATGSLVWAVMTWRHERLHSELMNFRSDLSSFRTNMKIIKESMSDEISFEVAFAATHDLTLVYGSRNGSDMRDFCSKCVQQDVFIGSLFSGIGKSSSIDRRNKNIQQMNMVRSIYDEDFPVMSIFLSHVSSITERYLSPNMYGANFASNMDDKNLVDQFTNIISDDDEVHVVNSKISDLYSSFISEMNKGIRPLIGEYSNISYILISEYLTRDDDSLKEISRKEKKWAKGRELTEDSSSLGDVTDFFQEVLDKDDWTKLVEARTRLQTGMKNG